MATKVLFVLLVLSGVAFFLMIRLGIERNDNASLPQTNEDKAAYTQTHPPPKVLSSLITRFSPKLTLSQNEFVFTNAGKIVPVPAGTAQLRNATFEVTQGCRTSMDCSNVHIEYQSPGNEGEELHLHTQHWKPAGDKIRQASFAILAGGGQLFFTCLGASPCVARLQ